MLRADLYPGTAFLARLNSLFSDVADLTVCYRRGNVIVVTFGVFVTAGAIVGMMVTGACLLSRGIPDRIVASFLAGVSASAVVGGHVAWRIGQARSLWRQPWFGLRRNGFMSWGSLVATATFVAWFGHTNGIPMLALSDAVARGLFGAYAIGRIGCLTYGCCDGRCSAVHGVQYRNPASKVNREQGLTLAPRHPTQVYSAIVGGTLFLLLNAMPVFGAPTGLVTAIACLLYPVGRAWVELYRERTRYVGGLFTTAHIGCVLMFLAGCGILAAVDPQDATLAPLPLSVDAIRSASSLAGVILLSGTMIFVATGIHWKQVGSW